MSRIHELQTESVFSSIILNVYDDQDLSLSLIKEMETYFDFDAAGALALAFSKYIKDDILEYIKNNPWSFKNNVYKDNFSRILELRQQDLKNNSNQAFYLFWNTLSDELKEEYFLLVSELGGSNCVSYIEDLLSLYPSLSHKYIELIKIPGDHPSFSSLDSLYNYLRSLGHHRSILSFYSAPKKEWNKTSVEILLSVKQGTDFFKEKFPDENLEGFIELAIERSPGSRTIQNIACQILDPTDLYFRNIFLKSPLLDYQGFLIVMNHFKHDEIYSVDIFFNFPKWSMRDYAKSLEKEYQDPLILESLKHSLDHTRYNDLKNNHIIKQIKNHTHSSLIYSTMNLNQEGLARSLIFLAKTRNSYNYHTDTRSKVCLKYIPKTSSLTVILYQELKLLIARYQDREPHKKEMISDLENKKRALRTLLLQDSKTKIFGIF